MARAVVVLLALSAVARATTPQQDIRAVMDAQVAAWNRGDIDAFASSYENSSKLLFVGKSLARGYQEMVARYKHEYPTPAKMGKLAFTGLEVNVLCAEWANVVGHFHLDRAREDGGNADGVFTLLFHHTANGWQIIQDHTS
jgi:uncharacterized protein (TIGR02246 family)